MGQRIWPVENVGRIQGPEGPAGKAATIRIGTTTTGEAGTEASVEKFGYRNRGGI